MLNDIKEQPVMSTYKHGCLSSATLVCTVVLILHPVISLHDVNEHQKQQHIELCPSGDKEPSSSMKASQMQHRYPSTIHLCLNF
jgi:hypothetical protein